jgi:hypothetical protein
VSIQAQPSEDWQKARIDCPNNERPTHSLRQIGKNGRTSAKIGEVR